ncbi:MAG: CDP-alcohol phosphatidyltransferase family protein [Candidatus Helarchaeota archaeon]
MNIKPNIITIIGLILACISSLIFYFLTYWYISIIYGVSIFIVGLLDGVDGTVARKMNKITKFGGFLDSVLDRLADSIILISFLKYENIYSVWFSLIPVSFWIFFAVLGTLLVSYSRSIAEKYLKDYNCDIGLAARSERLLILAISCWILLPELGLIIITIASILTAIYRQIKYGIKIKEIKNFKNMKK